MDGRPLAAAMSARIRCGDAKAVPGQHLGGGRALSGTGTTTDGFPWHPHFTV
jgi:hypothetical protein